MPEALSVVGRSASLQTQQKTVRAAFLEFGRDNGEECKQVYGQGLDSLKEEVACDEMLVRRFAKWLVEKYTKHDGEFIGGATACHELLERALIDHIVNKPLVRAFPRERSIS